MGKAAKQRLENKKRLLFDTHGDDRSPAERAHARVMLDALQKKLDDDALREDGFYFLDGAYVASRRPRTTSGMQMRSYAGHTRGVKAVALVNLDQEDLEKAVGESYVVTFGLDRIGIWDFKSTELVASLDVSGLDARCICGTATAALPSPPPVSESLATELPILIFAYATHRAPVVHTFDPTSKTISPAHNNNTSNLQQPSTPSINSFCAAHQQQIVSMAFSHSAKVLATSSWDSTCMLWRVCKSGEPAVTKLSLVLVQILPVHELGASCVRFTADDQQLITTGDCTIKFWDIATSRDGLRDEKLRDLESERLDWEAAIPFSLSAKRSMELLAFDDMLCELVPHHEWQHRSRDSSEWGLRLLSPDQGPVPHSEPGQAIDTSDTLPKYLQDPTRTTSLAPNPKDGSPPTAQIPVPINQDNESLKVGDTQEAPKADDTSVKDGVERISITLEEEIPISTLETLNILSPEDAAYLESYYRDLASFDFEQLLNPTLSLRSRPFKGEPENEGVSEDTDKENQSHADTNAPSNSDSQPITNPKELVWTPVQPNANGKLLQTFSEYDAQGIFSAHTSQITCCALSNDFDVLVTVALDKMLKFWSLTSGLVVETVREAHSQPITCCALTSQKTSQNPDGVLVATGGKDNLVKVWRQGRQPPSQAQAQATATELIYSFSGHYDSPTYCLFDESGVFLVTTGDDTNVITWRVVPSSPDQPSFLCLAHVDKFAITVSWDVPLANGSPLLHYVIRTHQVSSLVLGGYDIRAVFDAHVPAKYTSKTVENLQPGIQYTLEIAAVNAIGSSPFSDLTAPIETLAFVPSRIETPLQYSECEATRLRLTWKQPSPNGALIQAFAVRCQPENSVFVPVLELSIPVAELEVMTALLAGPADDNAHTKKKRVTGNKKPAKLSKATITPDSSLAPPPPVDMFFSYVVEGLWPGEIYQFVAAAENRCGLGAFSRVSDYVKMEPTAPDPPVVSLITNIQKRQVDVVWEKPKSNGSEILQYTLEWVQDDRLAQDTNGTEPKPLIQAIEPLVVRNSVVLLTRSIPGTSYTLQGLEPGKPVRVWLSASNLIANKICTSAFSPASDIAVTLCDVPDKPVRPELVQPRAHTLALKFTQPKCNGLAIESYDVLLYFEEVQFGITNRQVFREFKLPAADCTMCDDPVGRSLCFTIPRLRGKTYYTVKLCATNALGASLISDCSGLAITKSPTVPARMLEPPVIVDVEPTKANISWGVPENDGGAPLVAFHLQYSAQPSSTCPLDEDDLDMNVEQKYKALFDHEVTIYQGHELLATFLKPKTTYRFRVASSNAVGKAAFSKKSALVHTPSLVGFTISRYFADRPQEEHVKARFIQKRYRAWKLAVVRRKCELEALRIAVHGWHLL